MRSVRGSRKAWAAANAKRKPGRKTPMLCYERRKENVQAVGYTSYQDYLKSDEWARLRYVTLQRWPYCLLCRKPSSQVHHLNYNVETLLGRCQDSFVCLCDDCHRAIEFDGSRKRVLRSANKELVRLAQLARQGGWICAMRRRFGKAWPKT
jgi:hypothetical protein